MFLTPTEDSVSDPYRRWVYILFTAFTLYQIYQVKELVAAFVLFGLFFAVISPVLLIAYMAQRLWVRIVDRYMRETP